MVKSLHSIFIILKSLHLFLNTANISHATAVPRQYAAVMAKLENVSPYEEISLLEYEPTSSSERRKWRKGILTYFKCKVALFTVSFGNFLGTGQWIWKHPENQSTEKEISVVNRIKNSLPKFSTRAIRKNFFEQYGTVMKPCELRSVFFELTDYQYACENAASEEVDERFLKFISSCDDEEVVVDLRKYNGRMADTKFDPFWKELGTYLDEWTAVNDRRETSTSYLPLAISVEDLRTFVLKRLPADTPAPSASWIRLNFMPSSQFRASAQHYTGKFDVKYAVQQRLLRAQHEDAPYALHLWYMLKDMVVKYRDFSRLQCLDDKAIIPVGEPGKPVATGVRSHHRAMVVGNQSSLKCLDHDYHLAGIVASVALTVEIPESSRDSFYKGTVHVTVKDKVFQASSPLRHATENRNIVLENYTDDGVNLDRPILFRYTDGGPDHRTTYKSVKTACLLEFICLDLDMLICVRTAPNQSYNNPAERIMALLNLGLQNSALCRTEMSEGFEMQAKRLNSLASIRNYAEKNKVFKEAYKDSMVGPCSVVSDRFKRLSLKGESVKVHRPAEKEEIEALCEMIKIIDETFPLEKINDYQSSAAVKDFLEKHSQMRQYSFQMKKYKSNQCGYCVLNPPRLPHEVFDELHFLPDPIPDGDNHYKPFNEVYGTETVDNHRPSLKLRPELSDRDKKHKSLFVAAKVRGYVQCFDCGKRRVVYAAKKFTYIEQQRLSRVKEEKLYVCGSTLFPGLDLQDVVVVKEGQNCQSPIETTYYADVNNKMEDICFYCGCAENLADNPALHDLREQFGTVRPICEACWVSGKEPSTRNKRVNNKRAKKK
ncbi:uncharacterized protein LOC123536040 [Mercenaria mercenaria]|uniref:uncharacterized protein LOC123536040 n=1 Tax=Mercenaria mercenaria TaxID=6596 RepID=UPI00234EA98D|nr:uncharacterized protein LOC123536040 [Mercenaria mercenaria]